MNFKEIKQSWIDNSNEINRINERIEMREKQIERLKKKRKRARKNWTDVLIRPIMNEVKNCFPQLTWNDDSLVPMGLRSTVSVFGRDENNKTVASLVFVLGNYNEGQLFIETGERKNKFSSSTIGDLNGFNNVITEIKSLVTVFDRVNEQLDGILMDI